MEVALDHSCILEMCPEDSPVVIMSSLPPAQTLVYKCLCAIARCWVFVQNLALKHHLKPTHIQVTPQGPWQDTLEGPGHVHQRHTRPLPQKAEDISVSVHTFPQKRFLNLSEHALILQTMALIWVLNTSLP